MAITVPLILQAFATISPLFKKNSLSEKEDAKKVLKANHGPVSTLLAAGLVTGGVVYGSLEEAIYGVLAAVVGLGFYLYKGK